MNYEFRCARETEIPAIFDLYVRRVHWMDEAGICQWNRTDYLSVYPQAYYREELQKRALFVLEDETGTLCGAVVLLKQDERWADCAAQRALYVHNLVADRKAKGAGKTILRKTESLARESGLQAVRLDCAAENETLNAWYEEQGYLPAGTCADGPYFGRLREKRI